MIDGVWHDSWLSRQSQPHIANTDSVGERMLKESFKFCNVMCGPAIVKLCMYMHRMYNIRLVYLTINILHKILIKTDGGGD